MIVRVSDGDATDPSPFATSRVVTAVFDDILRAVHEGELLPGQRISDAALAEQLGVSRTPVREALQRLREIGIVEASANRFTRIADVSPRQTAEAMLVWLSLYSAVVDEVVPIAEAELVAAMRADHEEFRARLTASDLQGLATANLSYFSHLAAASSNATLQRAITSVVHIVRLGSLHLPERIDVDALDDAQQLLIEATERHDVTEARRALSAIAAITIPQEPTDE